ncbi:Bacterial Ig-like domain (group 2) [Bacillus subtilis]|nr:Bacterial Ig-like domain (group 2) [Bacillus subtilis]
MKVSKVVYSGIFSTAVLISQLTTLPHVQADEKKSSAVTSTEQIKAELQQHPITNILREMYWETYNDQNTKDPQFLTINGVMKQEGLNLSHKEDIERNVELVDEKGNIIQTTSATNVDWGTPGHFTVYQALIPLNKLQAGNYKIQTAMKVKGHFDSWVREPFKEIASKRNKRSLHIIDGYQKQVGNMKIVTVGQRTIQVQKNDADEIFLQVTNKEIPVEKITLEKNTIDATEGEEGTIKASVQPEKATNKALTYESKDPNIVTVDENGKWKAVKEGTTTITVGAANGKTAEVSVIVKKKEIIEPSKIVASKDSIEIEVFGKFKPDINVYPENATNKHLNYTSENNSIASVDTNGTITGKSAGATYIIIKTSNGIEKKIYVWVKEKSPVLESVYWQYNANTIDSISFRYNEQIRESIPVDRLRFYVQLNNEPSYLAQEVKNIGGGRWQVFFQQGSKVPHGKRVSVHAIDTRTGVTYSNLWTYASW